MSPSKVQNVKVEIMLEGGRRHRAELASNSPILRDLHVALAVGRGRCSQHAAFVVQFPLNGGRTACSFSSTSLIGLTTTPPVLLEVNSKPAEMNPALVPVVPELPVPNHVRIDDFLTPGENERLIGFALQNEAGFENSGVFDGHAGHRSSKVMYGIRSSKWQDLIVNRLKLHLPHIFATLKIPEFVVGNTEMQLTASNDGDYYKPHADHSPENERASTRKITYVYYLNREPKSFTGGDLLIYQSRPDPSDYRTVTSVTAVSPDNNRLIAFASDRWHELDLVSCPSGAFADSRFTVNGWLHPKPA